ncbi:MAG: hypothetical protein VB021_07085 [Oscillospiraceae bacterium]|nr:hypothetical protein [Oscillospiraceae bacterium]
MKWARFSLPSFSESTGFRTAYGDKYSPLMMYDSKREAGRLLNEYAEDRAIQKIKRGQQRLMQKQQPQQQKKKSRDDWER